MFLQLSKSINLFSSITEADAKDVEYYKIYFNISSLKNKEISAEIFFSLLYLIALLKKA